jgi:hypothetical protein
LAIGCDVDVGCSGVGQDNVVGRSERSEAEQLIFRMSAQSEKAVGITGTGEVAVGDRTVSHFDGGVFGMREKAKAFATGPNIGN